MVHALYENCHTGAGGKCLTVHTLYENSPTGVGGKRLGVRALSRMSYVQMSKCANDRKCPNAHPLEISMVALATKVALWQNRPGCHYAASVFFATMRNPRGKRPSHLKNYMVD